MPYSFINTLLPDYDCMPTIHGWRRRRYVYDEDVGVLNQSITIQAMKRWCIEVGGTGLE